LPEKRIPFHPFWKGDEFRSRVGDVGSDDEELLELGRDQTSFDVELGNIVAIFKAILKDQIIILFVT
jgi:hypothetical protein